MWNLDNLVVGIGLMAVLSTGCTAINDFSTDPGDCYHGSIVEADFVRTDTFAPDTQLTLTLDANALGRGEIGGTITTSDGLFYGAPISQLEELTHDQLSLFSFPGGRIRNYLAFTPSHDGLIATVVISLMENDDVEVRILRAGTEVDAGVGTSLFGIFRLKREDSCSPVD
jgi:hypothetical protein